RINLLNTLYLYSVQLDQGPGRWTRDQEGGPGTRKVDCCPQGPHFCNRVFLREWNRDQEVHKRISTFPGEDQRITHHSTDTH
uniref:MHC class I-like antigen recognition-like domain-containing protein n=1 Tax=Oreochromis aureus TaxID=47969 RepID=A0AAZ1WXG5_OREAU